MNLSITLTRKRGNCLPVNYQYPLSAWIYKVIARADEKHAAFLHEHGFAFDRKAFKMFTFSQLDLRPYQMQGNIIQLHGTDIKLILRFHIDASLENFVKGLFINQHCGLGDRTAQADFEVTKVETFASPYFTTTMRYECLSPIVLATGRDDGSREYLSPEDPRYGRILVTNLTRKLNAMALYNNTDEYVIPGDASFRLLNTPRKKGVTIKANTPEQTKMIGYLFHFELTAPVELHEIGYASGFGQENSMGMGCVEVKQ